MTLVTSNTDINKDLVEISRWAYKTKMSFNLDKNNQATEVYLSQRPEKSLPPPIIFNNNNVLTSPCQKHLARIASLVSMSILIKNKCNRLLYLQNTCKISSGL